MSNLFIPKTIKVGYQERKGTYTGKLAYIIYYDEKGKLRKEKSWSTWCKKELGDNEIENVPTNNFVLNKAIQRYNWSHFSSDRSMIRVYDPRGLEFEVTPDNLLGILMETDCNKRMLEGEFVYAWCGKELLLLPCGSQSYKEAVQHTERQDQKVSARNLKEGCSYTLKNGTQEIYMGRFPWYKWNPRKYKRQVWHDRNEPKELDGIHGREMKKQHIFWNGTNFVITTNMAKLSFIDSEEPVQEYAELMDNLKADIRTNEIVEWKLEKNPPEKIEIIKNSYGTHTTSKNTFFIKKDNKFIKYHISLEYQDNMIKRKREFIGFNIFKTAELNLETLKIETNFGSIPGAQNQFGGINKDVIRTEKQVLELLKDSGDMYAILESEKEYKLTDIKTWGMPGQR